MFAIGIRTSAVPILDITPSCIDMATASQAAFELLAGPLLVFIGFALMQVYRCQLVDAHHWYNFQAVWRVFRTVLLLLVCIRERLQRYSGFGTPPVVKSAILSTYYIYTYDIWRVCEACHTAFCMHIAYTYLIIYFGDPVHGVEHIVWFVYVLSHSLFALRWFWLVNLRSVGVRISPWSNKDTWLTFLRR